MLTLSSGGHTGGQEYDCISDRVPARFMLAGFANSALWDPGMSSVAPPPSGISGTPASSQTARARPLLIRPEPLR